MDSPTALLKSAVKINKFIRANLKILISPSAAFSFSLIGFLKQCSDDNESRRLSKITKATRILTDILPFPDKQAGILEDAELFQSLLLLHIFVKNSVDDKALSSNISLSNILTLRLI